MPNNSLIKEEWFPHSFFVFPPCHVEKHTHRETRSDVMDQRTALAIFLGWIGLVANLSAMDSWQIQVGGTQGISPHQALAQIAEHRRSHPDQPIDVIVADGTYQLERPLMITQEHSGKAKAPVRWLAAKDAKPVFSGGMPMRGFKAGADGIWRLPLPANLPAFDQCWMNGRRAQKARHPNQGFLLMKSVSEEMLTDKRARQTVTMNPQDMNIMQQLTPHDQSSMTMLMYHKWDNTRRSIELLDLAKAQISTVGKPMKSWNRWDSHTGVILQHFRAALDAPGEWYVDAKRVLHYLPHPGETPEKAEVVIPRLTQLLVIKGTAHQPVSDLSWHGIRFLHAGWRFPQTGFEPQQAAAAIEAVIQADFCDRIQLEKCEIAHTGMYGIWFRLQCHQNLVRSCWLHDLGAGGLRTGTMEYPAATGLASSHQTFDNNIIHDSGKEFPCAVGVWIGHSSDNLISHNDIGFMPYSGISVGWRWGYEPSVAKRNRIVDNHIHHIGDGLLSDMGAIYTLGPSEGTMISGNHIHHVTSYKYGGWGLYNDQGSTGIVMEKNLVHHTKSGSYHQHYGKENVLRNNILAFATEQQLQFTRAEEHQSFSIQGNIILWDRGPLYRGNGWKTGRFQATNNLYWRTDASDPGALPHETHSRFADPVFKDPASGDWTLSPNSPALALGFKPWDFRKSGVYGDDTWKKLSQKNEP